MNIMMEIIAVHLERMMDRLVRLERPPTFPDSARTNEKRVRFVLPAETDNSPDTSEEHLYEDISASLEPESEPEPEPRSRPKPEPRTSLNIFKKIFKKQ